jgi:putative aldouronate transport system permease protein
MYKRSIRKDGSFWGDALLVIVMLVIALVSFYPFFYVLFLSVMPYERFIATPVHMLPDGFTLTYFREVLKNPSMPHAYLMSVVRTVLGTTLAVLATMFAGYAISRPNLKWGKLLNVLFLIPMFFSAGLIPSYITMNAYGLTNTLWVLILPGLVSPMWFFVVKSTFQEYPREILEACEIDGAGQWRILLRIVLPTSLPTVATLALMYGMGHWNEYFMTRLLVKSDLWTAPVYLFGMINQKITLQGLGLGQRAEPQSYISAVAASLILPILVVYPLLQRYVISGLTAGAVKG